VRSPCLLSLPLSEATGCAFTANWNTSSERQLQGARCAQCGWNFSRPTKAPWRDRRFGRQPCPGGGLPLQLLGIPATVVMRSSPADQGGQLPQNSARGSCWKAPISPKPVFTPTKSRHAKARPTSTATMTPPSSRPGHARLEILEQVPAVEAVIVPIGAAGLDAALPRSEVAQAGGSGHGVEPERAASYAAALAAGERSPSRCCHPGRRLERPQVGTTRSHRAVAAGRRRAGQRAGHCPRGPAAHGTGEAVVEGAAPPPWPPAWPDGSRSWLASTWSLSSAAATST